MNAIKIPHAFPLVFLQTQAHIIPLSALFKGSRIESAQGVMLAAAVYDGSIDQTWFVRATLPNISIADQIEADLRQTLPDLATFTHLEPKGDPLSHADRELWPLA